MPTTEFRVELEKFHFSSTGRFSELSTGKLSKHFSRYFLGSASVHLPTFVIFFGFPLGFLGFQMQVSICLHGLGNIEFGVLGYSYVCAMLPRPSGRMCLVLLASMCWVKLVSMYWATLDSMTCVPSVFMPWAQLGSMCSGPLRSTCRVPLGSMR